MKHQKIDRFFKNQQGKWAVIQWPNFLLWAWIVLVLAASLFSDSRIKILQSCILFAWAYMELAQGDSYFRRTLGAVVLAATVFGALS